MAVDTDFLSSLGRRPEDRLNSSLNEVDRAALCRMMGEWVFLPYSAINVLVLFPVCCCALLLGLRQLKLRKGLSHTDFITLQVIFVEFFGILGTALYTVGLVFHRYYDQLWGFLFVTLVFTEQTLFHCLACLERYIAVVHPVTYMSLPKLLATRIRNACATCVWLIGLTWTLVVCLMRVWPMDALFVLLSLSLTLIIYCSLAVLRVLIRRRPQVTADRTKKRAFNLILLIMLVLMCRFAGFMASYGFVQSTPDQSVACFILNISVFLLLPGSFLLPTLFLHREGKSQRNSSNSEIKTVVLQ